jgi:hypothetical protein
MMDKVQKYNSFNSFFKVEIATGKHKSPGLYQILVELIKAGSSICSEIHKLHNSIWNKEELSQQWNHSIIVPIYEKGDKTGCSNYRGLSLSTYKILSNILIHTQNYWGSL